MFLYIRFILIWCCLLLLIIGTSCDDDSSSDADNSPRSRSTAASQAPDAEMAITEKSTPGSDMTNESQPESQAVEPVDYKIITQKDLSLKALRDKPLSQHSHQELETLPMNVRVQFNIAVGENIQASQIEPTVQAVIDHARSENEDVDEIVVFVYTDAELVNDAYDVAKAEWAPGGKWGSTTPEIAGSNDRSTHKLNLIIRDDLEEYLALRSEDEERFGFSLDERKQIFTEIVQAEDRADKDAENQFPLDPSDPNYKENNFEKYMDKQSELMELYKNQVYEKYEIDSETASKISVEAFQKRWPMPDIG